MEIVFLLILLGASVVFLGETYRYEVPSYDTSGGPAMFPRYVLIILCATIILLLIQLIVKKQGKTFVFGELFRNERGVFLAALLMYVLLLNPVGFLASTIVFLLFTVNYLSRQYNGSLGSFKNTAVRSSICVLTAVGVNYLFGNVFRIMLPTGRMFW